MPRACAACVARRSGGSPACQPPVPALSITISSSRPGVAHERAHHALRRRRAADVAHADEQDLRHRAARPPSGRRPARRARRRVEQRVRGVAGPGAEEAGGERVAGAGGVDHVVDVSAVCSTLVMPSVQRAPRGPRRDHELGHVDLRAEHRGLVRVGQQQVDRARSAPGRPGRWRSGAARRGIDADLHARLAARGRSPPAPRPASRGAAARSRRRAGSSPSSSRGRSAGASASLAPGSGQHRALAAGRDEHDARAGRALGVARDVQVDAVEPAAARPPPAGRRRCGRSA